MTHRSSVVLPAPFRPTSVTISPSPTCSDTSRSAWASPYRAERPSSSSAALGMRLPQIRGDDSGILADGGVRPLSDHAALLQHDHLVGQLRDDAHVVLDEHDGPAGVGLSDQLDRASDVLDAHACRRLVQQEQPGVERDREGELERALLSIRELACGTVREVGETDLSEELARSWTITLERTLGGPEPVPERRRRLQGELGVLESGELIEEARDLERARDPSAGDSLGRQSRGVVAEDHHASGGRPQKAAEEIEEARLPRAVWADERVDLPRLEPQVHAAHGPEASELFDEPVGLDRVAHRSHAQIRVFRPAQYGSRKTRLSVLPAALRGKSS